jgi:type I restriction enzyme, S subunit
MKSYPSYNDSGVEWIGEIPSGWEWKRLKYVSTVLPSNVDKHIYPEEIQVRLCNYTDVYYNDFITPHLELKKGSCNQNEFDKFKLRQGDVIITKDSESADDIGVPTFVTIDFDDVVCGYHLTLIRPEEIVGGYLFRFVQSNKIRKYFEINSDGITRFGLGKSTIQNMFLPLPPLQEQQEIVDYLDNETTKIDTLIEKTQQKIELLKERRTSLINRIVTKGLNPNVEMKDSGVEWIGEIPSGWGVSKLKYIFNYQKGFAFKSSQFIDEGIPVVKASDIKQFTIKESNIFIDVNSELEVNHCILCEKDIILSTVGSKYSITNSSVGQLALVPSKMNGALLNQNTVKLNLKKNINVIIEYLFYIFQTRKFRSHLDIYSHGTANQASLNIEDILMFVFWVTTIEEQQQIVDYLDKETTKIDTLIEKENQRVDLLKEYRQSLISEVVTGKIDVRNEVFV